MQMKRRGKGFSTSWTWELWERKQLNWVFQPGLLPGGVVVRDKWRGAALLLLGLWRRPQQAASAILGSDLSEQTQWPLWSGQGSPQGRILQGSSPHTLQEESLG